MAWSIYGLILKLFFPITEEFWFAGHVNQIPAAVVPTQVPPQPSVPVAVPVVMPPLAQPEEIRNPNAIETTYFTPSHLRVFQSGTIDFMQVIIYINNYCMGNVSVSQTYSKFIDIRHSSEILSIKVYIIITFTLGEWIRYSRSCRGTSFYSNDDLYQPELYTNGACTTTSSSSRAQSSTARTTANISKRKFVRINVF